MHRIRACTLATLRGSVNTWGTVLSSAVYWSGSFPEPRLWSVTPFPQEFLLIIWSLAHLYLTRTAVGVSALADGKTQAESLVRQYRNEINRKNDSIAAGRALYEFLIKPLPREALKHRLIIVPDGDLHLLPFDSLVDDKGEYLVASRIVTVAPSASVLYLIRTSTPVSRPSLTFPGVGDVQYQQGPLMAERMSGGSSAPNNIFDLAGDPLPNLPMTHDEIMEAAGIFGQKSMELLGADATEVAFKAEPLDQFRIIHIATHAIASATFPDRSALVLGEDSRKQEDGLLQAREIRRPHLNADLVTLSACDTVAGRLRGEEGIASLERSFLFAGARSVLAMRTLEASWNIFIGTWLPAKMRAQHCEKRNSTLSRNFAVRLCRIIGPDSTW